MTRGHWLVKSEPGSFSIADLEEAGTTSWTGVRNYQARNFLRAMKTGDRVLFYHSSCETPGVVGTAEVAREAHPDPTATDGDWSAVDLRHLATFHGTVAIDALRADPRLAGLLVLKRGNRLSVTPVTKDEYERVLALGAGAPSPRARRARG